MRYLSFLFFFILLPFTMQAEKRPDTVYMFGYATYLNDSTVYLTPVAAVPNAQVTDKNKTLPNREEYSRQFRNYMEALYAPNATCAVFFAVKRQDAEKKYMKVRRVAQKQRKQKVVELNLNDFHFKAPTK